MRLLCKSDDQLGLVSRFGEAVKDFAQQLGL
jgi:hypothetical protein